MAVNLIKGQKISLAKEAGKSVSNITLGLGWDTGTQQIDLDASCAIFDENKALIESIYFGNKKSKNNSIVHSGDNLTGAGDGDDEQIRVNLDKVDARAKHVVFVVTSYRGQKFTAVKNAYVRIVDDGSGQELCRFPLSEKFETTGLVMARLYRHNGEWKFAAMGDGADGKTVSDMVSKIQTLLG